MINMETHTNVAEATVPEAPASGATWWKPRINQEVASRLPLTLRVSADDYPDLLQPGVVCYTPQGVARVTERSLSTVRLWLDNGLPSFTFLGTRLIREDHLREWLERRRPPGRPRHNHQDF